MEKGEGGRGCKEPMKTAVVLLNRGIGKIRREEDPCVEEDTFPSKVVSHIVTS